MPADLIFPGSLRVTEQTIDLSGLTTRQQAFYAGLFKETVGIYQAAGKARAVIGLAGPTGAGKSVLAVLLQELARQAGLPFAFVAVTIDAYHYPNHHLLAHFSGGVPLKQVKGRFDTYDVPALARALTAFAAGENISFPAYSRELHDPVPQRIPVTAPATLLMVEGLWLLYESAGWGQIRPRLDFCYFIEAEAERTRPGVLQRHLRGGRTLADATRHYGAVDESNSALVLQTRHRADKVIPPYYLTG